MIEVLPFEVKVVTDSIPDEVEYLFWVGCASTLEDRAKKVTRAFAELLHTAGSDGVLIGEPDFKVGGVWGGETDEAAYAEAVRRCRG